jgi:hypothetical protein
LVRAERFVLSSHTACATRGAELERNRMANPFAHIELTTSDQEGAKKFYKKLFDWKLKDMPMGPEGVYTMIDVGKGTGGGMQSKPMPEAPVTWLPYVEVDDVNKTLEKVEKHGGKVILPYHDIGDMGAIGVFSDPAGAMLGIWSLSKPKKKPKKEKAEKAKAEKPKKDKAPKSDKVPKSGKAEKPKKNKSKSKK